MLARAKIPNAKGSTVKAMEAKVKVEIPKHILREMMRKVRQNNPSLDLDDLIAACIIKGIPILERMSGEEIVKILERSDEE